MSYRILHIADPHFSRCHFQYPDNPALVGLKHAEELKLFLKNELKIDRRFDAAILSGDFTFQCSQDGFDAARAFIESIAEVVNPQGIVVIPGNHDVDLREPLLIRRLSLPTEKEQAEGPFRAFLESIREHVGEANEYLSTIVRVASAGGPGLVIIGLNSCRVERWDAQGWGYIGMDQIRDAGRRLLGVAREGDLVVAVAHHNLLPIWDVGLRTIASIPALRKFSFTMDAGSALEALADLHIGVLLHGHTHVESVKRVEGYGQPSRSGYPTLILGAGSLGLVGDKDDPPHHFQVIRLEDNRLVKWSDWMSFHHPQRNAPRRWESAGEEKRGTVHVDWKPAIAQKTTQHMAPKAQTAKWMFECVQSWSALRAFKLPAGWPGVLARIHEDVQKLWPGATLDQVERAIKRIFRRPPKDEVLTQLPLEEYIARLIDAGNV